MAFISVFGEGTVSGTGAGNLTADTADSSSTVSAGETLQFNLGATTVLEVDETLPVTDSGTTDFVITDTTIDGNPIGPANQVELNYGFLTEDATGNLYTVWVFAYANSDEDQFYIVSDMGIPTRDGAGDIETVTQTDTNYSGQPLTVLDSSNLATGASTDAALNDFMLGDGTLTLVPYNNDLESAFGITGLTDPLPCFTKGTLIETQTGPRPIEDLAPSDMVWTKADGYQPIAWIGARSLSVVDLMVRPNLRPIKIMKGALGNGTPTHDLCVSPQHRVAVRSAISQRMFGAKDVLVAAKHLVGVPGVQCVNHPRSVTYYHILLDAHQIVLSNGAETESLFTGPQALKAVGPAARKEIFELFPELDDQAGALSPLPAAPFSNGRRSRTLVLRHIKNRKPLVA